jgi:serine protease Do
MPNDRQASAEQAAPKLATAAPHLGLAVAPATDVEGAGQKGVVVTSIDPDGPAAEQGLKTGDVILNVGGRPVANAGDVRSALTQATSGGKHSILMQVKTADATHFVAIPLSNG